MATDPLRDYVAELTSGEPVDADEFYRRDDATDTSQRSTWAQIKTALGSVFASAAQGALADTATQPGDLSTVATTGAYSDLSGTPTLGNAAALTVDADLATFSVPASTTISTYGASLVDDADAATARTTLGALAAASVPVAIGVVCSDDVTELSTGTGRVTFRMPHAMTLTAVRSSLTTASSSGVVTVDINEAGTSILSTKLSIDANETTSTTAATAAVISDSALADDAEITVDIDAAGTGAAGLKVWLIGTRSA